MSFRAVSFRVLMSLLSLSAVPALAHSEGEDQSPMLIDCTHPPENLAKDLPKAVTGVAQIECTPATQFIVAHKDWVWRYPGSFFDRPIMPAYAPLASQNIAGPRYFTKFTAKEVSKAEAAKQHEKFARMLPTYRQAEPPQRLLKLVAVNDLGHEIDAWFGMRSDSEGWVVLCTPDCAPENMFLMQKRAN